MVGVYFQISDVQFKIFFFLLLLLHFVVFGRFGVDGWGDEYAEIVFVWTFLKVWV